MEAKNQLPNLSAWEVAKAKQAKDSGRVKNLIEDLERFGYWSGCFEQLGQAVEELKSSTMVVDATAPE